MKLVICQHLAASSTWASNCTSLHQDNNRSSATFENVNFRVVVRSRFAAPDGADQQGEDSDYLRGNRGTTPCSYGGLGCKNAFSCIGKTLGFILYVFFHSPSRLVYTRVGNLIVATIYLQLIQNRYMFPSFTVLQCSQQHCVQPVASDVEVVGYL